MLNQLLSEVNLHERIESGADTVEAARDRSRTLASLDEMRLLLEHIGSIISAPAGTSGLTPLTTP